MKKTFFFFLIFLLAAGCLFFKYPSFLLSPYAYFFSAANSTKGADAIIVLAGGISTRLPKAIELYRQGYAPRILFTDNKNPGNWLKYVVCNEKESAQKIIAFFNAEVPLVVIPSLKGGATSTFDEAYDARQYCLENSFKHVIIVTDAYHTRRALYAFKKTFSGTGIRLEAMGAQNDLFNEKGWWQSDCGIEAYIMEAVKYAVYLLSSKNASFVKNY